MPEDGRQHPESKRMKASEAEPPMLELATENEPPKSSTSSEPPQVAGAIAPEQAPSLPAGDVPAVPTKQPEVAKDLQPPSF